MLSNRFLRISLLGLLFSSIWSVLPDDVCLSSSQARAHGSNRGGVVREVRAASDVWIANFNAGNVDAIANAYLENAIMWAEPFAVFEGRDAIRAFWDDLINNVGATNLVYQRRRVRVLSDTVAIVTSDWSMNIGGGIIYQEKWVKQPSGEWLLQSDHFDVLFTNE